MGFVLNDFSMKLYDLCTGTLNPVSLIWCYSFTKESLRSPNFSTPNLTIKYAYFRR